MSGALSIAHVLSSFGLGGQERIALELARAQRARGHHVIAVSLAPPPEGPIAAELSAAGVPALTVPKGRGVDPTLPLRLARELYRHRVDVVHTHNPQPLVFAALAARLVGAGLVHTKHGRNPVPTRRRVLLRAAATQADAFVAVSPVTADVARERHEVALDRLFVIDNGIDTSRYETSPAVRADVRRELGIDAAARVVGTVGRVAAEKDHALLVRACAPWLAADRVLVIAGDGPLMPELRAAVAALGTRSAHVRLLGLRTDIPRVLSALDVFALSSRTEGLPVVLLEAMATGLPTASTAVGGIPSVLSDATGLLVPSGDADALGAAITALLGDADRARSMGDRARIECRARYGLDAMVDAYLALYRDAVARRSRSRG